MSPGAGRGSGDELRVGVAARPLAALLDELRAVLAELDPAQVPARDAVDLVRVFDQISRVSDAGKTLAAGRVAESSLWSRGGHRSAAHWMAKVCGITVGDAARMLELAETVADAPATKDALVAGTLSSTQAGPVGRAEKADPAAGRALAASAPGRTFGDVQKEANRIVAAASHESPEEKAERHRKARRLRRGVDHDGMGWGSWLLPVDRQVRYDAAIEAEQRAIFEERRAAGEHEPIEAYAADALCRLLDRALTRATPAGSDGVSTDEDWSFAKIIVKVDLTALDRGWVQPGEICEIPGQGPIPVGHVWRMIDGNAFVAAVSTKGTEISKVVHLGRRPTVLQRTALEASDDGCCEIEDCSSKARLEIDHVAEWVATGRTELDELARVCGHHHDLKTHHGYCFGPRQPDGTRKLIPPPEAGPPPDETGPPALTLQDGHPPESEGGGATRHHDPASRARALARRRTGQGDLFDTG